MPSTGNKVFPPRREAYPGPGARCAVEPGARQSSVLGASTLPQWAALESQVCRDPRGFQFQDTLNLETSLPIAHPQQSLYNPEVLESPERPIPGSLGQRERQPPFCSGASPGCPSQTRVRRSWRHSPASKSVQRPKVFRPRHITACLAIRRF